MDLLLDELLGVLEVQTELYHGLFSVLKTEHEAIVESGLEKLNEANGEKEMLVLKIQNLEDQRLKTLDRLADLLGCPVQDLTLVKLSQFTEAPYSARLKAGRSNLLSITEKVRKANERNRSLLTHSIDLVKGSMVLLNNLIAPNAVYYRSGQIQNSDKNGRVFSSEI